MSTDVMFGPQWIRDLSNAGNGPNAQSPMSGGAGQGLGQAQQPPVLSRPILAEQRYGKEEMLALHSIQAAQPPEAVEFSSLFRDKPIDPINLTAVTEEEQKLIGATVNSEVAIRMNRGGSTSGPPPVSSVRGGRGGSRGGGRGGRVGSYGRHDEADRDRDDEFGGRGYTNRDRPAGPIRKGDGRGFEMRRGEGDRLGGTDDDFGGGEGSSGKSYSRPGWNIDRTPDRFREAEHGKEQAFDRSSDRGRGGGGAPDGGKSERGGFSSDRPYDRNYDRAHSHSEFRTDEDDKGPTRPATLLEGGRSTRDNNWRTGPRDGNETTTSSWRTTPGSSQYQPLTSPTKTHRPEEGLGSPLKSPRGWGDQWGADSLRRSSETRGLPSAQSRQAADENASTGQSSRNPTDQPSAPTSQQTQQRQHQQQLADAQSQVQHQPEHSQASDIPPGQDQQQQSFQRTPRRPQSGVQQQQQPTTAAPQTATVQPAAHQPQPHSRQTLQNQQHPQQPPQQQQQQQVAPMQAQMQPDVQFSEQHQAQMQAGVANLQSLLQGNHLHQSPWGQSTMQQQQLQQQQQQQQPHHQSAQQQQQAQGAWPRQQLQFGGSGNATSGMGPAAYPADALQSYDPAIISSTGQTSSSMLSTSAPRTQHDFAMSNSPAAGGMGGLSSLMGHGSSAAGGDILSALGNMGLGGARDPSQQQQALMPQQQQHHQQQQHVQQQQQQHDARPQSLYSALGMQQPQQPDSGDRESEFSQQFQQRAENMVAPFVVDEDDSSGFGAGKNPSYFSGPPEAVRQSSWDTGAGMQHAQPPSQQQQHPQQHQQQQQPPQQSNMGAPAAAVPPQLSEIEWLYRDPQGLVQGPFSSTDMQDWFSAGYFTMNLLVRRTCDQIFTPLGDMLKQWGRVPFMPGPQMMPLQVTSSNWSSQHPSAPQAIPAASGAAASSESVWTMLAGSSSPLQGGTWPVGSKPKDPQQQQQQQMSGWDDGNAGDAKALQQKQEEEQRLLHEQQVREALEKKKQEEEEAERQQKEQEEKRKLMEQQQLLEKKRQLEEKQRLEQQRLEEEKAAKKREEEERKRKEQEKLRKAHEERLVKQQQEEQQSKASKKQQQQQALQRLQHQQRPQQPKAASPESPWGQVPAAAAVPIPSSPTPTRPSGRSPSPAQRQIAPAATTAPKLSPTSAAGGWGAQPVPAPSPSSNLSLAAIQQQQAEQEKLKQAQRQQQQQSQQQLQQQQQQEQASKGWATASQSSAVAPAANLRAIQAEQSRQKQHQQKPKSAASVLAASTPSRSGGAAWASTAGSGTAANVVAAAKPASNAGGGTWGPTPSAAVKAAPATRAPAAAPQNSGWGPTPSSAAKSSASQTQRASAASAVSSHPQPSSSSTGGGSFFDDCARDVPSSAPVTAAPAASQSSASKSKSSSKTSKADDSSVYKHFQQTAAPADEFSQWCHNALKTFPDVDLDVETFVQFLKLVESPYELHDYVRGYLGDNTAANNFARDFIEKRRGGNTSKSSKNQTEDFKVVSHGRGGAGSSAKQQQQQQSSTSASSSQLATSVSTHQQATGGASGGGTSANRRRKKKMQKIDPASILSFGVNCADQPNRGEIQNPDA
ncbi:GRB10-interacting GYF protein 2-like isoform X5 [Sycon ciliatum]|uniref:GRB10-interacting GYF protein 2-like isoform X5 n=1 Tax=Sycon ciliatum TaxID=27933 RepID=UPI0031F647EF